MGSGPGPERIGSGRHRLCGARVCSSLGRRCRHVCSTPILCLPGLDQLPFVCTRDETAVASSHVRLEHHEMRASTVSHSPEPSGLPTTV